MNETMKMNRKISVLDDLNTALQSRPPRTYNRVDGLLDGILVLVAGGPGVAGNLGNLETLLGLAGTVNGGVWVALSKIKRKERESTWALIFAFGEWRTLA